MGTRPISRSGAGSVTASSSRRTARNIPVRTSTRACGAAAGDHRGGEVLVLDDRAAQTVDLPPVVTPQVSLRIDEVTAPGHPRFDQTAISDVVLADG